MKTESKSLEETKNIAELFTKGLRPGKKASVVGLFGDLGSGKTTFTQCSALFLGVAENTTSPTFVIEKRYPISYNGFSNLIHIDAYRLDSGKELLDLGWKEMSDNPKNLIFIEWPERVAEILPKDMKKICFKFIDEKTREIEVQ